MWKSFSRKEYVNYKLVYRKPFPKYCSEVLLAINVIALLFFTVCFLSYYAIIFAMSLYSKGKKLSKYQNMMMKNKTAYTAYGNGNSVAYDIETPTAYDNGTSTAYDNDTISKDYNFKRTGRHSEGYHVMSELTCFLATVSLLFICSYKLLSFVKIKLIHCSSQLDMSKSSMITQKRKEYLQVKIRDIFTDSDVHISKILSEENVAIFSHLNINHPNVMTKKLSSREIHYNLKMFMFYETWEEMPGNMPPFIDIVAYMRDILNGVQYLHDCHIYVLNISPENILIVADVDSPSGIAKIANFHYAMHTDKYVVENQKVGLDWIYSPPECSDDELVDAVAVDLWSIGVTAYEILTGGCLTIQSERVCSTKYFHKFIETEGLLKLSYFSSAVESCWRYTTFVSGCNNVMKIGDAMYDLSPSKFLINSWRFVNSLMQFKPKDRASIVKSLKEPFITQTINPQFLCSFKFYRSKKVYFAV